ncbi:SDR family NAD(P)-dependent oxidoreductase [Oligoflexus tunisiensis]|uniref:SDR family NAD(P)-dependent oxidoreductase n=1 Tax=Oligoflexus tunisiensis TaxID=708132 RepID=UPI00114D0B6E|nr:SDR family NAD(P)-dependent oxidoreductase [Oligoflexus tunisiensis]
MTSVYSRKRFVITGVTSGIGRDLSLLLNEQGARLALIGLEEDELARLRVELQRDAPDVLLFQADVSDPERMEAIGREILAQWGGVDVVIANAGIGCLNPGYAFSLELDRRVFNVNYFGMLHTFAPFLRAMRHQKQGSLVAVSSLAAFRGVGSASSYCASKAAQMRALESLRIDLKPDSIDVISVHPGFVTTKMAEHREFAMPFAIPVREASREILKAIAKRKTRHLFPWPMKILVQLNRLLPGPIYDRFHGWIAQRQGRKEPVSLGFAGEA